jgi:hypothetical protein
VVSVIVDCLQTILSLLEVHIMTRASFLPLLFLMAISTRSGAIDTSENLISATEIVKEKTSKKELGSVHYYYDSVIASCSTVLILGVGTYMSINDYDRISKATASGQPIVVIISDHNAHNLVKTSPTKYALLVNAIQVYLSDLIPICNKNQDARIIVGGHSASGEAAVKALQENLLSFEPVGFVGLDPYEISAKTVDMTKTLTMPAMFWGLSETTCKVDRMKAARSAYKLAMPKARILYVLDNDQSAITHCVFSDTGCGEWPLVCETEEVFDWVHGTVAKSIHMFVEAITDGNYSKGQFELPKDTPRDVVIYANEDEVIFVEEEVLTNLRHDVTR